MHEVSNHTSESESELEHLSFNDPKQTQQIYAQLDPQDVERFYSSYHQWYGQQRISRLQSQIAENNAFLEQFQPSPVALAVLARLQAGDVTDIDLLDRLLERGEDWLDQTMQRLDYCEQFGTISDGYTQWCENALEGAYDWIDSLHETEMSEISTTSSPLPPNISDAAAVDAGPPLHEATEEMLLQKLMSEEEEMLQPTLKLHLIGHSPSVPQEPLPVEEEPLSQSDVLVSATQQEEPSEEIVLSEVPVEVGATQEALTVSVEMEAAEQAPSLEEIREETPISVLEQPASSETSLLLAVQESESEQTVQAVEPTSQEAEPTSASEEVFPVEEQAEVRSSFVPTESATMEEASLAVSSLFADAPVLALEGEAEGERLVAQPGPTDEREEHEPVLQEWNSDTPSSVLPSQQAEQLSQGEVEDGEVAQAPDDGPLYGQEPVQTEVELPPQVMATQSRPVEKNPSTSPEPRGNTSKRKRGFWQRLAAKIWTR